MLTRRVLLAATIPSLAFASEDGFSSFLAGVRAEARGAGIRAATLDAALRGLRPDPKVVELDHNQPEFTLTWTQYRARVLPPTRLQNAAAAYGREAALLRRIYARYQVDPRIIVGIWGLESNFGERTGNFHIVSALATLAYNARRAHYFRGELMAALRILDHGDTTPAGLTGSWAGAMGQPQFMPSSYLRYAVDFDGDGRRDIWTSRADIFASVANYLAENGWRAGVPWGQTVTVPPGIDPNIAGRDRPRTLAAWMALGVRRLDGSRFARGDVSGSLLLPDGAGGDAFMVYENFAAIRRYNPSDDYALAVGLLGNAAL